MEIFVLLIGFACVFTILVLTVVIFLVSREIVRKFMELTDDMDHFLGW